MLIEFNNDGIMKPRGEEILCNLSKSFRTDVEFLLESLQNSTDLRAALGHKDLLSPNTIFILMQMSVELDKNKNDCTSLELALTKSGLLNRCKGTLKIQKLIGSPDTTATLKLNLGDNIQLGEVTRTLRACIVGEYTLTYNNLGVLTLTIKGSSWLNDVYRSIISLSNLGKFICMEDFKLN